MHKASQAFPKAIAHQLLKHDSHCLAERDKGGRPTTAAVAAVAGRVPGLHCCQFLCRRPPLHHDDREAAVPQPLDALSHGKGAPA